MIRPARTPQQESSYFPTWGQNRLRPYADSRSNTKRSRSRNTTPQKSTSALTNQTVTISSSN
jgi:hypothetical protein